MPNVPVITVPLFPAERLALLELLRHLASEEWFLPTVNPGWNVKDVAAHLLGDDLGLLSRKRDGYTPDSTLEVLGWHDLVQIVNKLNETWRVAAERLSPQVIIDLLSVTGPMVQSYLRTLDPNAIGEPVSWAGPDPAPVWLDVAREYTERWVHQQHIRDATGRPGLQERQWLHPVYDTFARALPYTLRHVLAPVGSRVRLVVSGPAGGTWTAFRAQHGWELLTGPDARVGFASATVTLPQDLAWRLFTKAIEPEIARSLAPPEGDSTLADPMYHMVTIIA